MIRCLHCGAETSNGLALCELSQRKVAACLESLPLYFRNLARDRRPGRPNGSLGVSGSWLLQAGDTQGSAVQAALAKAMNNLSTWARALNDDRDVDLPDAETEADVFAALCAWFEIHLTSVSTLEWAGQFVRDVARQEAALRELTEEVVPGWYAGLCPQVTGRDMEGNTYVCSVPTYVIPGLTWVTCAGCGATSHASDHIEVVLGEARDWIARPRPLAETLVALIDGEQSVERLYARIRKWESLGWLAGVRRLDADGDPVGAKMYRLGEVVDLAMGRADAPQRMTTA